MTEIHPPLYNSRYTILSEKHLKVFLPSYMDRYEGMFEKSIHEIDKYQFKTDQMFKANIIVFNEQINQNTVDEIVKILPELTFEHNEVYVQDVLHHGEYMKCKLMTDFLICDSYMLPIIGYKDRVDATEYGHLLNHRARITRIADINPAFLKTTV